MQPTTVGVTYTRNVKAQANPVLKGVNYQAQVKRKESWVAASDEEGGF